MGRYPKILEQQLFKDAVMTIGFLMMMPIIIKDKGLLWPLSFIALSNVLTNISSLFSILLKNKSVALMYKLDCVVLFFYVVGIFLYKVNTNLFFDRGNSR